MNDEIRSFDGDYDFLSNMYLTTITFGGRVWPSSENVYQAAKTLDEADRERIRLMTPKQSKQAGKKVVLRADWNDVKLTIMEKTLRLKFKQNQRIAQLLKNTGSAKLVEGNYWHDNYWGSCTCERCGDKGQNHLGILLTKIRDETSGLRVIVAGSRGITDAHLLDKAISDSGFKVGSVVCGMAAGVDMMGHRWAEQNNRPVAEFPADWKLHGKSAGYKRNEVMAQNADALIAIWDGESKGTGHMIDLAKKYNLKVYVHKT